MANRITQNTSIRYRDPLPDAVDVAIIGGGVIGVFAALFLARAGQRVLLCEKGRIAGEQSSRNWGWIRQQGRDAAELPIMMRALELWHEVDAQTHGACGLHVGGTTYLAHTQAEQAEYADWISVAAQHGLNSALLGRRAVGDLFGGQQAEGMWCGGLRTPSDARAEPWQAVPAVAQLAQSTGAVIREACAVRRLEVSAGQVAGIVTEDGVVRCDQVILAAGAWSALFAQQHRVRFPQLTLRGTVARTQPLPELFDGNACDAQLGFRRRLDGAYTLALADRHDYHLGPDGVRHALTYLPLLRSAWRSVGKHAAQPKGFPDGWTTSRRWGREAYPFEVMRVLDPDPNPRHLKRMLDRFAARFPGLPRPRIETAWAGMIDAMPDVVPIVDRVPEISGLILATGMSAHGFGIGPGYGEILSKIATGHDPGFDLNRFRFSRFSDGSRLEIGPEL